MDDLFAAELVAQWGDEWRFFVHKTWMPDLDDYDNGIGEKSLARNRQYEYDDHETDEYNNLDDFDW